MTLEQALQRWADSSTVEFADKAKAKFVRNGNNRPLTNQLRHCKDASIEVVPCDHVTAPYTALVKVTPAEPKPHADSESPLPVPPRRQPFHLFVG